MCPSDAASAGGAAEVPIMAALAAVGQGTKVDTDLDLLEVRNQSHNGTWSETSKTQRISLANDAGTARLEPCACLGTLAASRSMGAPSCRTGARRMCLVACKAGTCTISMTHLRGSLLVGQQCDRAEGEGQWSHILEAGAGRAHRLDAAAAGASELFERPAPSCEWWMRRTASVSSAAGREWID